MRTTAERLTQLVIAFATGGCGSRMRASLRRRRSARSVSIHLDPRSLDKLEEDAVLVKDSTTAMELARAFVEDVTHAKAID